MQTVHFTYYKLSENGKQNLLGTQASSVGDQEEGTQFFCQVYLDATEQDLEYLPG
jgi:hypothetical protein